MSNINKKYVLAVGGASGAIYAKQLIEKLELLDHVQCSLVFSKNAVINWELEIGQFNIDHFKSKIFEHSDFFAPFASGSSPYDGMVILPCSMGLLGRIANGISTDLITRAADVMLKEKRKLIIVVREAPYNLIHLKNMTALCEAGAIIYPASPSFYSNPKTIENVVDTVVYRIMDHLNISNNGFRWGV